MGSILVKIGRDGTGPKSPKRPPSTTVRKEEALGWDSALESLGEEKCLAPVKQVEFGRVVVVTAEGRPEIFPVNLIVHSRTVVFMTASSVLQARAPFGHVALEADQIGSSAHDRPANTCRLANNGLGEDARGILTDGRGGPDVLPEFPFAVLRSHLLTRWCGTSTMSTLASPRNNN